MFEIKIQIGGQGMRIQEIWMLKSLRMVVAREGWRGRLSQGPSSPICTRRGGQEVSG